ncbi:delta-lactam-biosynthetic de-N-acetylase [Clostridium sp. SYSU_GA19001]|uniref:delta-lactam-biosynthetic de-N-acetylase n=1 Tax=Clostridium caldaquaticum TaxID=2940653 RepID=UPI00207758C1|nr:delta-lactam-biosynthetic de-N-acetylase [Clostridium caldaquaticum]MCM8711292.1 delta-lactam-biosynthetic de-N-acetylase [Clostridium caldaquaticum]
MNKKIMSLLLVIPLSLIAYSEKQTKGVAASIENTKTSASLKIKERIKLKETPKIKNEEKKKNIVPREVISDKNMHKHIKVYNTNLNTSEKNWFYEPKKDGTPSGEPPEVVEMLKKYSGYYLGDTSKKVLYLTFDEGYERGYTAKILDVLKNNNVKAAFFVTTDYINGNKELIKRMVEEGHLVCNHSDSHPSMAKTALKGKEKFNQEFTLTEKAFEQVTGTKMPKFFRPPMGKYSELSMSYTQALGYKTIFWSFAYKDWIPEQQPSHEYAKKIIMERTHNGAIILLHAVSKTNADIMDSILKEWKNKGYEFKTLNDLP